MTMWLRSPDQEEYVSAARRIHGSDEVDIEEDARISEADTGIWVQAWVWVDLEDLEQEVGQ